MIFSAQRWENIVPAVSRLRRLLVRYPVIILPFIIIGAIDFILLGVIYVLFDSPLSGAIAPVIQAFGGEEYLHYPANMVLLPGFFSIARTAARFVAGVLLTAAAISIIHQAFRERVPSGRFAARKALKKYIPFAAVWGLTFTAVTAIISVIELVLPFVPSKTGALIVAFGSSAAVEMVLFYAAPLVIIENRRFGDAVKRSFSIARKQPFETGVLVLVPSMLALPVAVLFAGLGGLVQRFSPDAVLYATGTRIIVLDGVDFLMVSLATIFYLMHRQKEHAVVYGHDRP